jgi:hypothetical protein
LTHFGTQACPNCALLLLRRSFYPRPIGQRR